MIPITTPEQLIELAARSVYLLSGLRARQRESEENRAVVTLHKDEDVIKWEVRSDEFLKDIDAVDFTPLKELMEQLKLQNKTTNEPISS